MRRCLHDRPGATLRVGGLEDPASDEDPVAAQLHHQGRVGRRGDPARGEVDDRQAAHLADHAQDVDRGVHLLAHPHELALRRGKHSADLLVQEAHVPHGLDDVPGPRLPLGADHRCALRDPATGLSEVTRPAHERDRERPLVHVEARVGRGEDLGLVDVVDLERLQDLRLDEVADPDLGHHRDRDGLHDLLHPRRVGHSGDPALGADVGRDAFEGHHGDRARSLRDPRLLGGGDIHDHPALEHLRQTPLYAGGSLLLRHRAHPLRGRTPPFMRGARRPHGGGIVSLLGRG